MINFIENFFIKIYRKFLSKTFYKKNFKTPEFYKYYFSKPEKKYIVQVGGNDGVQNDPLRKYFEHKGNYEAVIFEPIQYYFQKLEDLYYGRNDILIKKFYVSNLKKEKEIYFINPQICEEISSLDKKNDWLHGLGSFNKNGIENEVEKNYHKDDRFKKFFEKIKKNIVSELVSPFELKNLNFPKETENLLVIDVQGFELEVLLSLTFNEKIDYIVYEDEFPYSQESKKIRKILTMHDYVLIGRLTWLDQIYKKNR